MTDVPYPGPRDTDTPHGLQTPADPAPASSRADTSDRPEWTHTAVTWRTGNKNARNLYYVTGHGEEIHVGVMFTEALGRYAVDHLNERDAVAPPLPDGEIGTPAQPES